MINSKHMQGKHDDAETMPRETLAVQQRVVGPNHPDATRMAGNSAACIRSARRHG